MNLNTSLFTLIISGLIFCPIAKGQIPDSTASPKNKAICITFDNLPADRIYDRPERKLINEKIIRALKKYHVRALGFLLGDNLDNDTLIIKNWLENGHYIGFHPYSGQEIGEVPMGAYIDDVEKGMELADSLTRTYNQPGRFFRFSNLRYGRTPQIRQEIGEFLNNEQVKVVHATVVTEDFVYNLSMEKIAHSGDSARFLELRREYLSNITKSVRKAEALAKEVMGRKVKQIMPLQVNRLNAMFLSDILELLASMGYRFITINEALGDPVYRQSDAYYDDQYVSYLERIKQSNPDLIPASEK